MKTTEAQQMDYIQKQMDYTALRNASEIEWLPDYFKLVLKNYAKTAQKLMMKAGKSK